MSPLNVRQKHRAQELYGKLHPLLDEVREFDPRSRKTFTAMLILKLVLDTPEPDRQELIAMCFGGVSDDVEISIAG